MDYGQSLELDLQLQYTKGNDRDYWIVICELQHQQDENGFDLFIRHDSSVSIDSYPNKRTGKISIRTEFQTIAIPIWDLFKTEAGWSSRRSQQFAIKACQIFSRT